MPTSSDGRRIAGLLLGGYTDHGQFVRFNLKFADNSSEPFHCSHDALRTLVRELSLLEQMAEKARAERRS